MEISLNSRTHSLLFTCFRFRFELRVLLMLEFSFFRRFRLLPILSLQQIFVLAFIFLHKSPLLVQNLLFFEATLFTMLLDEFIGRLAQTVSGAIDAPKRLVEFLHFTMDDGIFPVHLPLASVSSALPYTLAVDAQFFLLRDCSKFWSIKMLFSSCFCSIVQLTMFSEHGIKNSKK